MDLMYVIIDSNKQVNQVYVGDIEKIKEELLLNNCKAIQVTLENSPVNQGDYWDGYKFVKELADV
jgi:hypothetical protein